MSAESLHPMFLIVDELFDTATILVKLAGTLAVTLGVTLKKFRWLRKIISQ